MTAPRGRITARGAGEDRTTVPMIDNRGAIKLGLIDEPDPEDQIVVIEAFDEVDRQRVHDMMTENWDLISLVRRRSSDGLPYTEYRLRTPRPVR
jgi:hypothetical protein